ncbi:hypothetical protein A3B26_02130 [Candidatus Giovannonibacteria bacterium RIFCSPLOWO2_01_FULL_48_47]|nr:MAG: hypothetical protein A3B26_02130 [Candidatus Giovannonibacteria bacterium RIFCSPLOWO2_01_FULL_48_47]HBT81139.1 hypothetical protein [Candidatus Giovannonibacteria bacterium]
MHYVYLLKSSITGTKYIGCTGDLKKRLVEHNSGGVSSTKRGRPWKLIYYEAFTSKYDAFKREKELKEKYTEKRHLLSRLTDSLKE